MICKDCISLPRCKEMYEAFGVFIDLENSIVCKHFKNKADVVEVKRGYWKDRYGNKYDNHLYECSACGSEALYKFKVDELGHTRAVQALTSLCSNCGARMDRERKR